MVSPPTRSPSRLVARSRRPGQRRSRPSATSAAAPMTCSQLSSTSTRSCSPITSASRFGSGRPRAAAIAAGTPAGSPTGASSTRHPPKLEPGRGRPPDLQGQPRLAHPARAHQRDEAMLGEQLPELSQLLVAADERRQRLRDARRDATSTVTVRRGRRRCGRVQRGVLARGSPTPAGEARAPVPGRAPRPRS